MPVIEPVFWAQATPQKVTINNTIRNTTRQVFIVSHSFSHISRNGPFIRPQHRFVRL
jgi:hypothetical protein